MTPSAIALQKMLNLCYEFSLSNDIIFNPIKSQCMVFKPNRFKLYCPAVYLNGIIIDYVEKTKYLGYMFTNDKQDVETVTFTVYAIKQNNTHVLFLYNRLS